MLQSQMCLKSCYYIPQSDRCVSSCVSVCVCVCPVGQAVKEQEKEVKAESQTTAAVAGREDAGPAEDGGFGWTWAIRRLWKHTDALEAQWKWRGDRRTCTEWEKHSLTGQTGTQNESYNTCGNTRITDDRFQLSNILTQTQRSSFKRRWSHMQKFKSPFLLIFPKWKNRDHT